MKRILGCCIFMGAFFCLVEALDVSLNISDAVYLKDKNGGENIQTVFLNEPFEVEVVVSGKEKIHQDVEVEGLNQFLVKNVNKSSSFTIYNSKTTLEKTIIYEVTAMKEGVFTLGPVKVECAGKVVYSKSIPLKVAKKTRENYSIAHKKQHGKQNEDELFCELEVDKKSVVVGEPVIATLNIYKKGNIVGIDGVQVPEISGFSVKEIEKTQQSKTQKDGYLFTVIKKLFRLVPQKTGVHEIEPMRVVYRVQEELPKKKRHSLLGDDFFASFFGGSAFKQKVASTLPVQVAVCELPDSEKIVDAIGEFSCFKATVDKNDVELNEPIRFKLEIDGSGNFDYITISKLVLPDFFKSYESKTEVHENGISRGVKIFEFVVQIGRSGENIIPSQELFYFDTKSHSYKTMRSNPISVNVKNVSGREMAGFGNDDEEFTEKIKQKPVYIARDINFIEEDFGVVSLAHKGITLCLFIFLIMFIPFFIFTNKWVPSLILLHNKIKTYKKDLLDTYQKEFKKLVLSGKSEDLHNFFMIFLANIFCISHAFINDDLIEQKLKCYDWENEQVYNFLHYLNKCAKIAFTSIGKEVNNQVLFQEGEHWVLMLGQIIRGRK